MCLDDGGRRAFWGFPGGPKEAHLDVVYGGLVRLDVSRCRGAGGISRRAKQGAHLEVDREGLVCLDVSRRRGGGSISRRANGGRTCRRSRTRHRRPRRGVGGQPTPTQMRTRARARSVDLPRRPRRPPTARSVVGCGPVTFRIF